ncbi:MAG: hypothetical protein LBT93_07485, partial [Treponema sp.]|nr:hypothetical protein [Treponema sp.]
MKNKYKIFLLAGGLVAVFLFSCATTPAPEAVPPAAVPAEPPVVPPQVDPEQGPPDQAVIDALNAAKARIEASRTLAMDTESPRYFSEDWEAVEKQYRSLGESAPATRGEFRAAVD